MTMFMGEEKGQCTLCKEPIYESIYEEHVGVLQIQAHHGETI